MSEFVNVQDFENYAYKVLPKNALDYYKSGAGEETTLENNRKAFSQLRIKPKCLVNVSKRDLTTCVLGKKVSLPVGVAPTAMQKMASANGEMDNARAAGDQGTIFILSTLSTSSIEDVAQAAPDAIKWFQLYIYNDRDVTRSLIKRAEKANFQAIVLTIDTPFFGIRYADMKNKFTLPLHLKLANFEGQKAGKINDTVEGISGLNHYVNGLFDDSLTWDDVKWLIKETKLPVVVKGVLTAEDALKAVDLGVSGIIVSNHGARQLDGTPASIEALPEVVQAVGNKVEVYLDGGVRCGTDVFKALALGAKMVFIGRPAIWGLTYDGKAGVNKIFQLLKLELESTLAIAGCPTIKDIKKNMVVHKNYYSKL